MTTELYAVPSHLRQNYVGPEGIWSPICDLKNKKSKQKSLLSILWFISSKPRLLPWLRKTWEHILIWSALVTSFQVWWHVRFFLSFPYKLCTSCPIREISFHLYQIQLSRQLSLLKKKPALKFVVSSNVGNVSKKKIFMLLINFHFLICPCF